MSKRTVNVLLTVVIVINIVLLTIFGKSQAKSYQAEEEVIQIVKNDYEVDRVNKFYWTTIDETFFSLDFIDSEGVNRYAIVKQDGGDVFYYEKSDIITEQDAEDIATDDLNPHKILQTRLGLHKDKPVWEVTIRNKDRTLTYYYIDGESGNWYEKIEFF